MPPIFTHINNKKDKNMCKLPDGTQKISIAEMVNSAANGKTSNSGVVGLLTCVVMLIVFLTLTIYYICMPKDIAITDLDLLRVKTETIKDIMEFSSIFFAMGTALLGVRKIAGAVGNKGKKALQIIEENIDNTTTPQPQNKTNINTQNTNNTTIG